MRLTAVLLAFATATISLAAALPSEQVAAGFSAVDERDVLVKRYTACSVSRYTLAVGQSC